MYARSGHPLFFALGGLSSTLVALFFLGVQLKVHTIHAKKTEANQNTRLHAFPSAKTRCLPRAGCPRLGVSILGSDSSNPSRTDGVN